MTLSCNNNNKKKEKIFNLTKKEEERKKKIIIIKKISNCSLFLFLKYPFTQHNSTSYISVVQREKKNS